ncbi:MAG: substrate-binding domain-containing protein [Bacillota bacterium]|nr:substrate-binding domain-containing protein [Bacillota bacterium]
MKRTLALLITGSLIFTMLVGCGGGGFNPSNDITVISREEGSGTRGAFIELFGIEEKDANNNKIDKTLSTADINDSTGIMLTNVSSNQSAIGYISMGSLNNTIKAVKIDGAQATAQNVKNGTYKIARPFNIATKGTPSGAASDFISFILSTEGQKVVQDNGYIALTDTKAYSGTKPSGKVVIAGSSSVTPVMEKLKEAYLLVNQNATIEIQQSDSTTGINSTIQGICDIGMSSRDLKDSETQKGLTSTKIAIDGIAVIVNSQNTVSNLSSKQVKDIYTGVSTKWQDVIG